MTTEEAPAVPVHRPLKSVAYIDGTFKASCSCGEYAWGNVKKTVVKQRDKHIHRVAVARKSKGGAV